MQSDRWKEGFKTSGICAKSSEPYGENLTALKKADRGDYKPLTALHNEYTKEWMSPVLVGAPDFIHHRSRISSPARWVLAQIKSWKRAALSTRPISPEKSHLLRPSRWFSYWIFPSIKAPLVDEKERVPSTASTAWTAETNLDEADYNIYVAI